MLKFLFFNVSTGTCSDAPEHVPVEKNVNKMSSKPYMNITVKEHFWNKGV